MKLKKSVTLFALMVSAVPALAQYEGTSVYERIGTGKDSIECLENLSLFQDACKTQNWAEAYSPWKIIMQKAPCAQLGLYTRGATMLEQLIAGTTDMDKLGGMEHAMPWTSWTSVIALFSTAGVPPLSGFWSKLLIIVALWEAGLKGYAVIALLFSTVTLAYFVMMQRKVFFGRKSEAAAAASEVSAPLLAPVVLMSAVIVGLGLLFPYVFSYLRMMAGRIIL